MNRNLNSKVSKTATGWKKRAKQDRKNRGEISRAQKFALELMDFMDRHDLKQKDLAEKMGVSPQQVSSILRAKENLTFESIDRIAEALGARIESPKIVEFNPIHIAEFTLMWKQVYKSISTRVAVNVCTPYMVLEESEGYSTASDTAFLQYADI